MPNNINNGKLSNSNSKKVETSLPSRRKYLLRVLKINSKEDLDKKLAKQTTDYYTTSNDNTKVAVRSTTPKIPSKTYNSHLNKKGILGAKAHAAWVKEHPILSAWGNTASAVPFVVAAAPALAAGGSGLTALGDSAAATSAGQAITSGLGWTANAVKSAPIVTAAASKLGTSSLFPWFDAGLTSLFGAHGVQTAIDEGGVSPETALEISPLGRLAKSVGEVKSLTTPFNDLITPKVRWYGKAAIDGITNPIGTYMAIKDGRYIKDFASLRRNYTEALKDISQGIKSTNREYKSLTGIDIPETDVSIRPWKHFSFGTSGYYAGRRIYMPLTRWRASNIKRSSGSLRHTGGHELAHAADDWLEMKFGTPDLGVYKPRKFAGSYFVPNPDHPIAKKYERKFKIIPALSLNIHGMYPGETWANYMGAKARGISKTRYKYENFMRESLLPPKGFLEDYLQYLTDTYSPKAHFFK